MELEFGSPRNSGGVSPLNRKKYHKVSLAQELLCVAVSRFLYQKIYHILFTKSDEVSSAHGPEVSNEFQGHATPCGQVGLVSLKINVKWGPRIFC